MTKVRTLAIMYISSIAENSMKLFKEALLETTGGDFKAHTYYLNDDGKLVGFSPEHSDKVNFFSKALMFDKRGRKFKKVK